MAYKTKKPLGGLLTAAQIALPLMQDKFEEMTAAPIVPDTTYNSNPYGKMPNGGPIDPIQLEKMINDQRLFWTNKLPFGSMKLAQKNLLLSNNPETVKDFPEIYARTKGFKEALKNARDNAMLPPKQKRRYENGGLLPNGFTQHNSPSHDDGGQSVDAQGKPSMVAPVAEIQNKENVFNNYVYSDMLKNPKTGKTFNIDMQKLAKKYKHADTDLLSKTALNISADNLAKTNDLVRSVAEQEQAVAGIPQASNGIDLEPLPTLPINIVPGQVGTPTVPQELNMNLPHIQNPFETMIGQDVQDPFDTYTRAPTYINKVMSNRFSSNAPIQASTLADAPLDYSDVTGIDDKLGTQNRGFNYNTAALIAKGLGFAGSVENALKPAEKENLVLPDYSPADASFDRASIDYTQAKQDVLGASNILGATNRNASSGFSQFRNREAARIADVMDKTANINMQERNANSQLDITRGQYRSGKAQDIANRTYQNNVDNLQNKAVKQQFQDQMFSELTQIGSSLNQHETFKQELANRKDIASINMNQFIALAKAKGLNFTLGEAEEFLNAVKSGQNPIKFTK